MERARARALYWGYKLTQLEVLARGLNSNSWQLAGPHHGMVMSSWPGPRAELQVTLTRSQLVSRHRRYLFGPLIVA